jgi:hypothetical protein
MAKPPRYWFEVEGYEAHEGDKVYTSIYVYSRAENSNHALWKYNNQTRGVKKSTGRRGFTPNVRKLNKEQGKTVEKKIIKDGRISLLLAKQRYYKSSKRLVD